MYRPAYYPEWHFDCPELQTGYSKPHIVTYAAAICNSFLLMLDNLANHSARLVVNCLKRKNAAYGVASILSWLKSDRSCILYISILMNQMHDQSDLSIQSKVHFLCIQKRQANTKKVVWNG